MPSEASPTPVPPGRFEILVKPGSKRPGIERSTTGPWLVRVREPAQDGRANEAVITALAGELAVARSRVRIVRGHSGRRKLVEIL